MASQPSWASVWKHTNGVWYSQDAYTLARGCGLRDEDFTACDEHGNPVDETGALLHPPPLDPAPDPVAPQPDVLSPTPHQPDNGRSSSADPPVPPAPTAGKPKPKKK